jgi:trehalose/maltose transport system permease protein
MVGENDRNFFFYFQRMMFGLVILFFIVYSLFPVLWGISTSFKTTAEAAATPITYLPQEPTLANYAEALRNNEFLISIWNSVLIATGATALSLVLGGLAAYSLGRYRFRGRSMMRYVILAMNLFPTIAVLPSLFETMSSLGLIGNIMSLIVTYPIFTLPTITWSLIVFFQRLPEDIEQAAFVDGASTWQLFTRILLPISAPVLFTTGIITFVGTWSEYLLALSFVSAPPEARNVTVAINFLRSQVTPGVLMAMSVLLSIPLLVVIYFTQRNAIKETTAGAVKG